MEKQKLLFHQARLANRGVAEMVLLHISASKGQQSDMVMKTLELGISVLRGGNLDIQLVSFKHQIYLLVQYKKYNLIKMLL
jgi:ryanodine receptor 2